MAWPWEMDEVDQALEFEPCPGGFFDDLDDQDLLAAALRAEELGKWHEMAPTVAELKHLQHLGRS